MCQILMLTNLAPAIQEAVLFLPKTMSGRDPITENRLRRIASLLDWEHQRQAFRALWAGSVPCGIVRASDDTRASPSRSNERTLRVRSWLHNGTQSVFCSLGSPLES